MSHRGWWYRHLEHLDVHRTGNGGSQASARGPIPVAPVQHAQPFEVKSTPEKVAHTAYSAMAPSTHSTMFFHGHCTRAVALWCACFVAWRTILGGGGGGHFKPFRPRVGELLHASRGIARGVRLTLQALVTGFHGSSLVFLSACRGGGLRFAIFCNFLQFITVFSQLLLACPSCVPIGALCWNRFWQEATDDYFIYGSCAKPVSATRDICAERRLLQL